jgi:hypothetical protein
MTESNMNNSEKTTFDFFNYEFNDNKNYKPTHLGEKHIGTIGEYYDIKISDSNFIKLYHSNRNIDMSRVITMCDKFKVKLFDFPPLIVAHIVDIEYDKDEYVLIDGQHRYSTIKELNFNPITKYDIHFYGCYPKIKFTQKAPAYLYSKISNKGMVKWLNNQQGITEPINKNETMQKPIAG